MTCSRDTDFMLRTISSASSFLQFSRQFHCIFAGTFKSTEAVDKDIPKPIRYSVSLVLYGIFGYVAYKVIILDSAYWISFLGRNFIQPH